MRRGIFAYDASVYAILVAVLIWWAWIATGPERVLGRTEPVTKNPESLRVAAVLDGIPGSGKTTICEFIGQATPVVEKDLDYFTQPVYNPYHHTSKTAEGIARRRRWMSTAGDDIKTMLAFIRQEILDYLVTVPDGMWVVFCGVSALGDDFDVLPPQLGKVPKYRLQVGAEETAKRSAYRAMLNTHDARVRDCSGFQERYDELKREFLAKTYSAYRAYAAREKFAMVSCDGSLLIRAIMERTGASDSETERIVADYRSLPSVDLRISDLARRRFGVDCHITP